MGFSRKQQQQQQPEDVIQTAPNEDIEKTTVPAHEEERPTVTLPAIDPELERRVVRKLDWRVPTLLGFFCTSRTPGIKGTYNLTMSVGI